ncbi:hypothetical protein KGF56_001607 [Candida oxycetoniae]|uniref:Inosine/uridine-preferring nucleoside hydrolase domain-containing protein n=1 Tax=Candida oxycetoniae TaxID=497107 RepID=A0AAI9WZ17_9ASCO|nr:uncharacterized protein KGF56_001607 [Candida oxycetoniae]KAI3405589.1 hypothetical protein KGF56_001607 [Candida oxycetoniae]
MGTIHDVLTTYNLTSCIPLYKGAAQPLLRTKETFQIWQDLFGSLVWQGAFTQGYEDIYSWSNFTYDESKMAAVALIDAVKANKDTDPIYIYAAGMMTTIAQALSLYPSLVNETSGLYVMGGYFDTQYAAATGTPIVNDINTDINLIQDPEAAQIVFTSKWKKLVFGANVTNYLVPSQHLYNRILEKAGNRSVSEISKIPYFKQLSNLLVTGNYSQNTEQETLPFWDDVVSAFLAYPDLIQSETSLNVAVDTQFYSPFYGSLRIWGEEYAPRGVRTGNATVVNKINDSFFYDLLIDVYFEDFTQYCHNGVISPYYF